MREHPTMRRPPDRPTLPPSVLRFARTIGELHSISTVDAGLLGLAVSLEVAAGRGDRVRSEPPPPRVARARARRAAAAPASRPGGAPWAATGPRWTPWMPRTRRRTRRRQPACVYARRRGGAGGGGDASSSSASAFDEAADSDADGWNVAATSAASARRRRRAAARREARAALAAAAAPPPGDEDDDDAASDAPSTTTADDAADDPAADSPVSIVTADFAMQNVALQMGLRLVAPGGARVARAARWALRCSACAATSRDPERVFCPKCGGATLDKVEVVVGVDGAETVGVRKQHCLRGTRFSLPAPKGGRARDPILREDVLLAKTRARAARGRRRGGESVPDAFAPEAGDDAAWLAPRPGDGGPGARGGGVTAFLPGWKNNPNESKPHGRRRK